MEVSLYFANYSRDDKQQYSIAEYVRHVWDQVEAYSLRERSH